MKIQKTDNGYKLIRSDGKEIDGLTWKDALALTSNCFEFDQNRDPKAPHERPYLDGVEWPTFPSIPKT